MRNILEKCSYKGSELEHMVLAANEIYTFEQLSTMIQASNIELKNALIDLGAFQIDGNINENINNCTIKVYKLITC